MAPGAVSIQSNSNRGSSGAPSRLHLRVVEEINKPAPVLSHGVFPADLHGMRRRLPEEWAAFLKHHFNGDVTLIRAFFDVDGKTARAWLHGDHGVNAAPFLLLVRKNPVARQFFIGEVA
jgi:hypothetical protein